MTDKDGTTKYVTVVVKAVFYGDYIDADETVSHLQGWIDSGLQDRDDLRAWGFEAAPVREVSGDAEEYDS